MAGYGVAMGVEQFVVGNDQHAKISPRDCCGSATGLEIGQSLQDPFFFDLLRKC
jgi:hypothetical protein